MAFRLFPIVSKFVPFVSSIANTTKIIPIMDETDIIVTQPYISMISQRIGNDFVTAKANRLLEIVDKVIPNVRI